MPFQNSTILYEGPCPYLPDLQSRSENAWAYHLPPEEYIRLLGRFWRRSGCLIYRPRCRSCSECLPLRVLAQDFQPSKSQRRTLRRNDDLTIQIAPPTLDASRLRLYQRYQEGRHAADAREAGNPSLYRSFLVESPVPVLEFSYWLGTRLLAIGIVDDLETAGSSVYFYYDLEEQNRRLGVYSMLIELEWAKNRGYVHHYLGYWVQSCSAMAYKSNYRPVEILRRENCWEALS